MPAVLLVPGTVAAVLARRACGPPGLLRNTEAQTQAIAQVMIAMMLGLRALRVALPRPARLLRLRGRQDAVLPPARRHRVATAVNLYAFTVDPSPGRHRRRPRPDREQPRGRPRRVRAASPPARAAAPAVDHAAVRPAAARLGGGRPGLAGHSWPGSSRHCLAGACPRAIELAVGGGLFLGDGARAGPPPAGRGGRPAAGTRDAARAPTPLLRGTP